MSVCPLPTSTPLQIAIEPKSKADADKMGQSLYKLAQEDPSFHFSRDDENNQTVIEGMGELHLDIIMDRLRREFKVDCAAGPPQVRRIKRLSLESIVPLTRRSQILVGTLGACENALQVALYAGLHIWMP